LAYKDQHHYIKSNTYIQYTKYHNKAWTTYKNKEDLFKLHVQTIFKKQFKVTCPLVCVCTEHKLHLRVALSYTLPSVHAALL